MHHLLRLLLLFVSLTLDRRTTYAASTGSLTCNEEGQQDNELDLTCSNRDDNAFSCEANWKVRPCKCDPKCGLYDECCPNHDEMVVAGTLVERFIYPDNPDILPDKMAWEDNYLSYMTCVTLWGISYKPQNKNFTISASYHMISKCPASILHGSTARQYCENSPTSEDIFITPITVENIGHFKNIYCALCHGVPFTDMLPWWLKWQCDVTDYTSNSISEGEESGQTVEELIALYCSVLYEPPLDIPDDIIARPCFQVNVTTCSIDDTGTQKKCPSYLAPVQDNGTIYQNLHCAHCNGLDVCEDYSELCKSILYEAGIVQSGIPPALAQYFSFVNDAQALAAKSCGENEAFDLLTSTCQLLYCFPGFEYNITIDECQRVPVDEKGRISLSFYSGQTEMNMTSSDTEYLSAAVNNMILEASLEVLAFSFVVSMPELSCIPAETLVDDCNETPHHLICQVCFDAEMNFTALPQSYMELDLGTDRLFNDTSCLYMPSFGNLSMVELLIDVPAGWSCQAHDSWTFADYNKPSLQPFQLNLTRDREDYILSVFTIDDICANYTRLVCDQHGNLESSEFEMVTNQSKESLRIINTDTVILQDQFQINPDGSAVYCVAEYVSAGRNLPDGLDIMNLVGTVLSIISVLIIITTYLLFPKLRNLAGKSVLTLSTALLITFLMIFAGAVSSRSETLCEAMAAITHFFWLSIFFWMNALAIDLNRTFGSRAKIRIGNKSQIFYVWYSLYAWGTPALIVGGCLLIDLCDCTNLSFKYGDDGLCWLSSGDANLYGFGVPLAALLFLNAILFSDTVVGIRLTKKASERALKERPALARAKEELSLYIKLSGVMGFTWILAFVCEYANVPELWYIFTALNSLQGFFILLAFGFNRRFIAQWKEKLGIRRDDITSSTADTKSTSTGNTMFDKKTKDPAANQM